MRVVLRIQGFLSLGSRAYGSRLVNFSPDCFGVRGFEVFDGSGHRNIYIYMNIYI